MFMALLERLNNQMILLRRFLYFFCFSVSSFCFVLFFSLEELARLFANL